MTELRRILTLTLPIASVIFFFTAVVIPVAPAQQPQLLPAPDPIAGPSQSRGGNSETPKSEPTCQKGCNSDPNGKICEEADYWVVSSRPCRGQDITGGCVTCKFEYFQCCSTHCNSSDSQKFEEWFQPGVPVCVVVHGSFTGFDSLRDGSLEMYKWIRNTAPGKKMQIVFYTWPSEGPITSLIQIDIAILGRRSASHGIFLTQLTNLIPKECSIGFFGHSHGARAIASALHLMGGGSVQGYRLQYPDQSGREIRVVFAAAALDHHWLNPGERYGRALCRVESLLNLRNRYDLALKLYPLRRPFSRRALGDSGFTRSDRRHLGSWNHKLCEIDVRRLIGRHHLWEHYYSRPNIAEAIMPYLYHGEGKSDSEPSAVTLNRK